MIVHGVMMVVATSLLLVVGVVAWLMTTIHSGCGVAGVEFCDHDVVVVGLGGLLCYCLSRDE